MNQPTKSIPSSNIFTRDDTKQTISLHCPTSIPDASAYLFNQKMMLQMNCRGYASAQHMQPEPAKYSYNPSLEAKTFMQPEHHYHAGHPGRFFYIKIDGKPLFSLPYEPMRVPLDSFMFSQEMNKISWHICQYGVEFTLYVTLGDAHPIENWHLTVNNTTNQTKEISIIPCFSIGYASWMNQSADFDPGINGIVASYVTPYQKVADFYKQKDFLEKTVLLASAEVNSFDTQFNAFIGEGGLHNPSALQQPSLGNSVAKYQTPIGVLQHNIVLEATQTNTMQWLFGAVKHEQDTAALIAKYFGEANTRNFVDQEDLNYYKVATADPTFDSFVNIWLPRQIHYHCQTNRLTQDPQTRNFLQDHMASALTKPAKAKQNFLFALAQQNSNGAMPDGILLHPGAELKYINQIPHSDHNVWLFIFLDTYLSHTADLSILNETVAYSDNSKASVLEHLTNAAQYLFERIDHRQLSFIEQGDWCDPMNMVGKEGKGVSFWLTLASAYSFGIFASLCEQVKQTELAKVWRENQNTLNSAVNQYGWDKRWYARGICDNNRTFGIEADTEGQIYLNPQAWSMLSGAPSAEQTNHILNSIDQKLDTPFGVAMLAPAYTQMDEDIGRLTQKYPGTAENGSVYNHAASFYAFALLENGHADRGFKVLRNMLVDETDVLKRKQLPNYVPNYYRGAYYQHPDVAGRSSHLFNTGTCAWYYRCVVESMFGIHRFEDGLIINPCLTEQLGEPSITLFVGSTELTIKYLHVKKLLGSPIQIFKQSAEATSLIVDNNKVSGFTGHTSVILYYFVEQVMAI